YLTDDNTPGVLFKFEAAVANDYTDGQLFAYKQLPNSFDGTWVALPMEFDSLLDARGAALRRGATMFNRLEWVIQAKNGRIFFTETGRDNVTQFKPFMAAGTNMPARHMLINPKLNDGDSTFTDYYGRVLELIPGTNTVRVFVEGGTAAGNAAKNLASPDGLAATRINGRDFLLIQEDLIGSSLNRDPQGNNICEAYFADASKPSVEVDDLVRLIIAPNGSEITGGVFTPDGKTLFVNIQHPDNTNTTPYNNSTTIAVTNYAQFMNTLSINEQKAADKGFQVYPNPATREITFNKVTDIAIYNLNGEKVRVFRNTDKADVSTLTPGVYFVQTLQGEVNRLIVQ
ncbi:MAG TPA: alkaline phosphatase PhoX, partial [Pseudomonadales bacterium]|nr:alkaline phosphatase PhoX [Pseudomonadales bacterium]